jgi:putative membrane protein
MLQHLLLIIVMPPLILIGTPKWLVGNLLNRSMPKYLAKYLARPIGAFIVFNSVLVGWHIPALYDITLANHNIHILEHITFMFASILMWAPIVGALPNWLSQNPGIKCLYVFCISLPMGFLGAIITFSNDVLYKFYLTSPKVWNIPALVDQQIGGIAMKTSAVVFLFVFIGIFLRWFSRHEKMKMPDEHYL